MPSLEYEVKFGYPQAPIIGVDEVGRGCLVGHVVAAAAILPIGAECEPWTHRLPDWLARVNDSKQLTGALREEIAAELKSHLLAWAIGEASPAEIDTINIYHASHLAMARAVARVVESLPSDMSNARVLVDGNKVPKQFADRGTPLVKGDQKSVSIAAASILAKVHRDAQMVALDREYPGYGFAVHKGYPTPVHQAALARLGVLRGYHRESFGPVRRCLAFNGQ